MTIKKIFKTSDFCLASTLIALGFNVTNLDRSNPKRIIFIFDETQELLGMVANYWRKRLTVLPMTFFQAQKELKTLMYQGGKNAP